jgi:hypothetical protein
MSLEDDIRKGIESGVKEGLDDYRRDQEMRARWAQQAAENAAYVAQMGDNIIGVQQRARELIQNGDYSEATKIAWSVLSTTSTPVKTSLGERYPFMEYIHSSNRIFVEALWKWGNACEQGGGKYPKDEAKALELYKGAAYWGNGDAQQRLKQRSVKFRIRGEGQEEQREGWAWLTGIAAGVGLAILVSKLPSINVRDGIVRWVINIVVFLGTFVGTFIMMRRKELESRGIAIAGSIFSGLVWSFLLPKLFNWVPFVLRWMVNIAGFCAGFFVPFVYFHPNPNDLENFSLEPLRLIPPPPKKPPKLVFAIVLAAALCGWASLVLPSILGVPSYIRTIPGIVAYYKEQAAKPAIVDLDVPGENGAAKIFRIHYGEQETVISIIRTTGSHKAVSIAKPGEANSFYVKDNSTGETWPLKEVRLQDYENAAGVELVFDPFKSRVFDLIEGEDTTAAAWHFRNVSAVRAF